MKNNKYFRIIWSNQIFQTFQRHCKAYNYEFMLVNVLEWFNFKVMFIGADNISHFIKTKCEF